MHLTDTYLAELVLDVLAIPRGEELRNDCEVRAKVGKRAVEHGRVRLVPALTAVAQSKVRADDYKDRQSACLHDLKRGVEHDHAILIPALIATAGTGQFYIGQMTLQECAAWIKG